MFTDIEGFNFSNLITSVTAKGNFKFVMSNSLRNGKL